MVTPGSLPSWQATVDIPVDTDGLEHREPRTVPVHFRLMPLASVTLHGGVVPDGVVVTPWEPYGGTPSIPEILLNIPVGMLPEDLYEQLASDEAVDGEGLA